MAGLDVETRDMILDTLSSYAEDRLTVDYLLELDHKDEFPTDVLRELYDPETFGLHLLFIPEDYGGLDGGAYDIYRVSEIMAGIDLGIGTGVLATFLGLDPITVGATDEQKEYWMSRVAEEGMLIAYGATEPQAGSDLASLSTKAVPVEEDGKIVGYKITGRKQWISNGGVADLYTILANAPGGPSWFIVEREKVDGFTTGKPEDKHGIRASNTSALFLEDVYVPVDQLVGLKEGNGLAEAQAVFGYTRLMVGTFGLGAGWEALRRAIRYSQERIQAGAPLSEKQGYTHKLIVPNAVRLEACRSYIEWVAERLDFGEDNLATEGAVAKYMATEGGNKAAEDAIQALGGYGYTKEYMVEKIKRDVRITTIYEGTSEIMEWTIARDRWQSHLKSRGAFYRDWASRLDAIHSKQPANGADIAALGLRALAVVLDRCREDRLTRQQHILFRIGELVAFAELAATYAERVVDKATQASPFSLETQQAMCRVFAREAALKVAVDGLSWTNGAGQTDPNLADSLNLPAIYAAQKGGIEDMDTVAVALVSAYPAAQ